MKNYTLIVICSLLLSFTGQSQTTLLPGQIAFTGMNCDGTPDAFSFVILRPGGITAGSLIKFSDVGYCSSGMGNCGFTGFIAPADIPATDGEILWISSSAIGYGIQVTVSGLTSSHGTVTAVTNAASGLDLSSAGDQIFAFQGGSLYSGTLLAGIHLNNQSGTATDANWDGNAMNTTLPTSSTLPAGLFTGTSAMRIDTEVDNVQFNCTGLTGAASGDMLAVNNRANYNVDDVTPFTFPNSSCSAFPIATTIWNGSLWNYGAPTSSINAVIASNVVTGSFTCKDLTINEIFRLNTGQTATVTGTLTNNVTIGGTGTIINSSTINTGNLSPAWIGSTGILSFTGNLENSAAGLLSIEIRGTTASTQYDQLLVSGAFTAGGTLNITTLSGFTPALNDQFVIVDAGTLSGTFTTINMPSVSPNVWNVIYDNAAGTVTLLVTQFPLPVTLTQFNAQAINNDIQLNWKTSREVTFSHYIAERSIDGIHFSEVSRIEPLPGTMEKSYVFTDKQAMTIYSSNNKLYYRLKLVDIDGNYEYSQVIVVSLKNNTNIITAAGPNPFTDKINININMPAKGTLNIRLTDINGRIVLRKQVMVPKGFSTVTENSLNKLGSGIYWLQTEYEGKTTVRKFIKY